MRHRREAYEAEADRRARPENRAAAYWKYVAGRGEDVRDEMPGLVRRSRWTHG